MNIDTHPRPDQFVGVLHEEHDHHDYDHNTKVFFPSRHIIAFLSYAWSLSVTRKA